MSKLLRLFSKSYRKALSDRDYWSGMYTRECGAADERGVTIVKLQEEAESLKEEIGRLEKHVSDLANQNSQLRKAKEMVRDCNVSLNSQYNDATNVARKLQDRINKLRESIAQTTYWATKQKGMKPEDAADHPDHILIERLRDAITEIDEAVAESKRHEELSAKLIPRLNDIANRIRHRFGVTYGDQVNPISVEQWAIHVDALISKAAGLYDSAHIALGRMAREKHEIEQYIVSPEALMVYISTILREHEEKLDGGDPAYLDFALRFLWKSLKHNLDGCRHFYEATIKNPKTGEAATVTLAMKGKGKSASDLAMEFAEALDFIDTNTLWSDDVDSEMDMLRLNSAVEEAKHYIELSAKKESERAQRPSDEASDAVPDDQAAAGERGAAGGTPGEEAEGRREAAPATAGGGDQEG